jgi:hypothetical protein
MFQQSASYVDRILRGAKPTLGTANRVQDWRSLAYRESARPDGANTFL